VLSYTLQTEGVAAHSAYPELGTSAVHALLNILDDLRKHDWGRSPLLGEATTNIGLIHGGVALNVFAPSASATVMHRIVDDAERRKAEVEAIVAARAAVQFHSISQPQILETVDGFPLVTVGFGTDVPYLKALGPCLLMGPGSIHQAHTADEFISVNEMEEAVLLYKTLYDELLKR
jgi:acetylornithine deacetylase